jgi:hypothetical protein
MLCVENQENGVWFQENRHGSQGNLVVLNCNSKKIYISAMEKVFNCVTNHQKHQIFIG